MAFSISDFITVQKIKECAIIIRRGGWKTNRKYHLKSEFALFQTSSMLFSFIFCQIMRLNPKEPYLCLEKERFCVVVTYSIKRAREIRKLQSCNDGKEMYRSVTHVQSCCVVNINLLLFCRSRCRRRRRWLSFQLLWSRNFATMVTWRHTSPLYWPFSWWRHLTASARIHFNLLEISVTIVLVDIS